MCTRIKVRLEKQKPTPICTSSNYENKLKQILDNFNPLLKQEPISSPKLVLKISQDESPLSKLESFSKSLISEPDFSFKSISEQKWQCKLCEHKFYSFNFLKNHFSKVHNKKIEENKEIKNVKKSKIKRLKKVLKKIPKISRQNRFIWRFRLEMIKTKKKNFISQLEAIKLKQEKRS